MSQSQLLGNGGEVKNGEGVRKRLKISVAHFDNSALIKNFSKTLLGRCMNPEKQEMPALISNLPKIWKLEERVVGTDLGFGKFQFDFETVEDMEGVLKNQPFHFDYWMLALARWQPKKSLLYPSEIPFWVRIIGVPVEFKTEATFESIGDAIGRTVTVDLDHSRVQVVVDAFKELCLSLCHKDDVCPLDVKNTKKSPEKKREGREGNGVWHDGAKYDDRARSYKGVVINGNANQQQKEREGREYYGKGKGKMGEETDSKWMKVPERGNKRANNNRGTYRGDGEASRYRPARREDSRSGVQSGHLRHSSEQTKQPFQQEVREEVREEGEIRSVAEARIMPPSQAFQVELANTQAEGTTVISDPTDVDRGLAEVHGMQEDQVDLEDEDVMDMDEIKAHLLENGIDMDAEDFLEETAEEETEEVIKEQAEDNNAHVTDGGTVEEEQGPVAGNAEKKPGLRKRLFKASTGTAGSSKLRAFNALASPRKRAAAKPGVRPGDTIKQAESKGASNLKLGTQKI
ncbi:hypothetical protein YC2023_091935 [Brassica napus]